MVGEEPASGRQIPLLRDEDVDDLAELVNRAVQIDPASGHFDVRLIDKPPITGRMPAGSCRVDQQRREPLHPAVDGHVIDLDAPLDQQLFDVAVGQGVAEILYQRTAIMITSGGKRKPAKLDRGTGT